MRSTLAAIPLLVGLALSPATEAVEPTKTVPRSAAETKQKIAELQAEQRRLLQEIRAEIARLPVLPSPSSDEPEERSAHRSRREQLLTLLKEIESRINADSKIRAIYVTKGNQPAAVDSYSERLRERIEAAGTARFPSADGQALYGRAVLLFSVNKDGTLGYVEVIESSSKELADHATALIQELSPFEPFPKEVAKIADRIVLSPHFNYIKD